MLESRKTNRIRGPEFILKYLSGSVLDIGCGPDLVVPHARPFDIEHGDANFITHFIRDQQFDCVHSSHCLEHMRDPAAALSHWWQLVRPGGYLVTVVPDEDLYEQGYWPSLFNSDHKWTFRVGKETTWSPVSNDIETLVRALPQSEILSVEIHDNKYQKDIQSFGQNFSHRLRTISAIRMNFTSMLYLRNIPPSATLHPLLSRIERSLGVPIDQTLLEASAQIQVVARKSGP